MPHHEAPLRRHAARTVTHGGHADAELTALLPEITGPSGQFRHRQHIHLAFLAVRRYGMPEATTRICDWIQRIAAYERAPQKYHHTVSRAWVEIVAHHVGDRSGLLRLRYLRRPASRVARQAPAGQALPVLHPGRRPGAERLGRAGSPAVPLVARPRTAVLSSGAVRRRSGAGVASCRMGRWGWRR